MSHTAGPWHQGGVFNPDSANPTVNIWTEAAKGNQSGDVIAFNVSLPNAKLIAAAPDLLEALTLLLQQIDEHWHDETIAMGFARAAIEKATT